MLVKDQERIEKMQAMRAEGMTLDEIGKAFGVTRARVLQIIGKTSNGVGRGSASGPRKREDMGVRFWKFVNVKGPDDCWEWNGTIRGEYGAFGTTDGQIEMAHRVAWKLTNGPIPDGMDILHGCDNPPCCNPNHLHPGTTLENVTDMWNKGRAKKPYSLSKSSVLGIVEMSKKGYKPAEVARQYGTTIMSVYRIMNGTSWSKLTGIKFVGEKIHPSTKLRQAARDVTRLD
jgi:uncharacterized protein (DUF433 family)